MRFWLEFTNIGTPAAHSRTHRLAPRVASCGVFLGLCIAALAGPRSEERASSERLLWTSTDSSRTGDPAVHTEAALASASGGSWIAYVDSTRTPADELRPPERDALIGPASFGAWRTCAARVFASEPVPAPSDSAHICIVRPQQHAPVLARFEGSAPGLAVLRDRSLLLVYQEPAPATDEDTRRRRDPGRGRIVVRRGSADGRDWGEALPVCTDAEPGVHELLRGRLALGPRGLLVFPEIWHETGADTAAAHIVCHRSQDGGRGWEAGRALRVPAGSDPVVQALGGKRWLMVLRRGRQLARSSSEDAGRTWSAPEDLGIPACAASVTLGTRDGKPVLAWTDPPPDTSFAAPGLASLRLAMSRDAGRTWSGGSSFLLRPGRLLRPAALAPSASGMRLLFEERNGPSSVLACMDFAAARLDGAARAAASAPYTQDPAAAREALRIWCAHTLARPQRSQRLFVEAYFMRSLVAAHEALAPHAGRDAADWYDTRAGVDHALAFADTLLARQDYGGLWSLGYQAVWWADMGAAVGLFPMIEPYTDEEHMARYQRATSRFLKRLEAEGMILESGAIGLGREKIIVDGRSPGMRRDPYLVSTALCGIEAHAWLYHRSHEPRFKQRALAALEYTLAQIEPEGFREEIARKEGNLRIAGYVQEGWMAADALLEDPAVLQRLKAALPQHVEWLLRTQRLDGTWDSGAEGESARTPAIINFLIWYDQRCETRPDVRQAVRRAGAVLIDRERWKTTGLYRAGSRNEVLRAMAGRPLAALAGERWVR